MIRIPITLAAVLLAGTALAQGTASPGVNPSTGTRSDAGVVERNQGTAAASGARNQAVATTDANAPQPARGSNSFTQGQAQSRMESNGFQNVTGLRKDDDGVWRGSATKDGRQTAVWLDYKGNVGQGNTPAIASTSDTGRATDRTSTTNRPDGTPGNPPGTAASRATDRALGTNMTGTNPGGSGTTAR